MIQNISIVKVLGAIEIAMPVAYTKNILRSSNDTSRIVLVHSRVTLQIAASLSDDTRGIIYNHL